MQGGHSHRVLLRTRLVLLAGCAALLLVRREAPWGAADVAGSRTGRWRPRRAAFSGDFLGNGGNATDGASEGILRPRSDDRGSGAKTWTHGSADPRAPEPLDLHHRRKRRQEAEPRHKGNAPRFAYAWILGVDGDAQSYARGIAAAVLILRSLQAHVIHVVDDIAAHDSRGHDARGGASPCDTNRTIVVEYVLIVPEGAGGGSDAAAAKDTKATAHRGAIEELRAIMDRVIGVPAAGARGFHYAEHYLKLHLLGLSRGGLCAGCFYDRVLYLEADYVPLRSLSHLFVQEPSRAPLAAGPVPEWEAVSDAERAALQAELGRARDFATWGGACRGAKRQFVAARALHAAAARSTDARASGEADGFIAMPAAYWIQQPCYMAGGPILVQPSARLYELYGVPITHCNTSSQPVFHDGRVCNHHPKWKGICAETEMGYLNRLMLHNLTAPGGGPYDPHRAGLVRTLHAVYTALKNEFVFQPPPRQAMRGYWTRNFFGDDAKLALQELFGVHFAGGVKQWTELGKRSYFGQTMPELDAIFHRWAAAAEAAKKRGGSVRAADEVAHGGRGGSK